MNVDVRITCMLEPFCVSKNERQSAFKILLKLKGQFLVMEIRLTFLLIYFYDLNIFYLLNHVMIILGTLRFNDAMATKRQKNNWFKKENNNFACALRFFVHFFPVFARLRRENA